MNLLPCSLTEEAVALYGGISDIHFEKIEEVSPPIADRSISVVEGIDDAMRLSCLTILSSESSDTHGKCILIFVILLHFSNITHQYCNESSSNIFSFFLL